MNRLKRPLSLMVVGLLAILVAPAGADAAIRTWDGGAANTNWHAPANWSGDLVPTLDDDVVIPGGQQAVLTSTPGAANSLRLGTSPISGGVLQMTGAGAVLTVDGGAASFLDGSINASAGGALNLKGTTTWSSGGITGDSNGLIDNDGPMTIATEAGGSSFVRWTNSSNITYQGTDVMSISPGTFLNTGTVATTAGTLSMTTIESASTGDWTAGAGSVLAFTASSVVTSGAELTGTGTMRFVSGELTVAAGASYTVAGTTEFTGGTLLLSGAGSTGRIHADGGGGRGGPGTFTVNGIVGQPSQILNNVLNFVTGPTVIKNTTNAPDLTISGGAAVSNGSTLTLEGQTTWSGGNLTSANFSGGTIDNDGTMTITTGAANSSFADWANSGTVTYEGTDTIGLSAGVFVNTGTVDVTAGTLTMGPVGAGSDGDWIAGAAGVLAFSSTSTLADDATVTGSGTVRFNGGTLTMSTGSTYAVPGITRLAGGTLSLADPGTTGRFVSDGGGGRTGAGTLTVNGVAGQPSQIVSSITNFNGGNTIVADGPNAVDLTIAATVSVGAAGTLTSMGTSQWTGGSFGGEASGTIDNRGPMTIATGAEGSNFSRWVNSGAITYTGTDQMNLVPTLKNTGTIATSGAGGTLSLGAVESGSTGDWTAGAGSTIAFGTGTLASGADVGGAGTVLLGGTLTAPSGTTVSPGTLILDNSDNLVHGGTGSPGTLQIAPNGTLSGAGVMTPSALTWSGGTMSGTGRTVIPPGGGLTLSGAKALDRTLRLQRDLNDTDGLGTWSGAGAIEADDGVELAFTNDDGDIGGTITVRALDGGTIVKSGGLGGASETTVPKLEALAGGAITINFGRVNATGGTTNAGTTFVGPEGALGGAVANNAGGIVQGDGPYLGAITNAAGATVRGTPTIGGALTNNGTVAPGNSAGTITAASYSGAGALVMELVSAASFDKLVVTGSASLGSSTMTIQRPGGFVPATSDAFDVVTAGTTVTGTPTLQGHVITPEHRLVATALNGQPAPAGRLRLSSFTEDLTAPDTTITSGPAAGSTTGDSTPTLEFTATEGGSTFACSIDGGASSPCSSAHTTGALANGSHTFSVAATDGAGNTDASPATRTFTVDTKVPVVATPTPEPKVEPKPAPPPPVTTASSARLTETALAAVAKEVLAALPSVRRCVSRRRLAIRLRPARGTAISTVAIRVGTKKPLVLRGRRITAPVVLAGLPKGRFTVKVTMTLANGQQSVTTRRYRTCVPKRKRA